MSDLISRQAALAVAAELKDDMPDDERIADAVMAHNGGLLEYQTALSLLPSAQPEQKRGQWLIKQDRNGSTYGECSRCHSIQYAGHTPYCPYCGADMRGEQDE